MAQTVKRCCLYCGKDTKSTFQICSQCDNKNRDIQTQQVRDWDREAMFDGCPGEDDYSEDSGPDSIWMPHYRDWHVVNLNLDSIFLPLTLEIL